MDAISGLFDRPKSARCAILVSLRLGRGHSEHDPRELAELVRSAGLQVAESLDVRRAAPDPALCLGKGKVDELKLLGQECGADALIIDRELSATQQRNLERALAMRVMTRTELIIYIFSLRARTHEGRLQVELAALRHAQTRITGGWSHLDRQRGGVNLRGVGESQLDIDRRLVSHRVGVTRQRLDRVRRQRATQRRLRTRSEVPQVALVGYTNAGKSTLFNRLCESEAYADDRLFATLDATMRTTRIEGVGPIVVSDTVGFIRNLPVHLVDAFRSTLEEVANADLLLHVIDSSSPDLEVIRGSVMDVLSDLGADAIPLIEAFNKSDLPNALDTAASGQRVAISAKTGAGIASLRSLVSRFLGNSARVLQVHVEPSAAKTRSWLYDLDAVVGETVNDDGSMDLEIRISRRHLPRLEAVDGVSLR